jgi:hypothetical protein
MQVLPASGDYGQGMESEKAGTGHSGGKHWWQQPLVHFILIGAALFTIHLRFGATGPDDAKTIVVDRAALLTFLQYRAQTFDPTRSEEYLGAMDATALDQLIDDYVRQEVLYREAKALGLDRDDFVIRQRLIQKLEFINQDPSAQLSELSEEDLRSYFEAHREDYVKPSRVVMAQVFFDLRAGGREQALQRAETALSLLNSRHVPFNEGPRYGDRFLYEVNFMGADEEQVSRFLGPQIARAVMSMEPSDKIWQGPLPSEYGYHLVMLTSRSPRRYLELEEIRPRVQEDARQARVKQLEDAVVDKVIQDYEIRVDYPPASGSDVEQAADKK